VLQLHGTRADRLTEGGDTIFKFITKRLYARVGGLFVLSQEEAQIFRQFVPETRVYAVANPFAPPLDASPRPRLSPSEPLILFAGRLLPEKGILDVVHAFARIRRSRAAHLFIAGDGPAGPEIARAIQKYGLSGEVTLAGQLDPAELMSVYQDADVFALPTYHPEGFPTVLAEAMNAGLPIVTTRARGSADYLLDGTNALFVPPRRPDALADALKRLIDDPALRARMAAANRQKVLEFAPRSVAPVYVSALQEIRS
jgi:glycosyltransferase involved in cell wall biosynthesis